MFSTDVHKPYLPEPFYPLTFLPQQHKLRQKPSSLHEACKLSQLFEQSSRLCKSDISK